MRSVACCRLARRGRIGFFFLLFLMEVCSGFPGLGDGVVRSVCFDFFLFSTRRSKASRDTLRTTQTTEYERRIDCLVFLGGSTFES